jgi:hypothetical protein
MPDAAIPVENGTPPEPSNVTVEIPVSNTTQDDPVIENATIMPVEPVYSINDPAIENETEILNQTITEVVLDVNQTVNITFSAIGNISKFFRTFF